MTRNVPTSAHVANGATVEKEIPFELGAGRTLRLGLRNPDLTTAMRMAEAVTRAGFQARASDPHTVELALGGRDVVSSLARIEELTVTPDNAATVVIDETSGTIVMGANVRISTVAIAQGNLTIRVSEAPQVSQPAAFSNGRTTVVPRSSVSIDTGNDHKLGILPSQPTLRDLVGSLNAMGIGPRDLISILQSIKAAGALQADLQVR